MVEELSQQLLRSLQQRLDVKWLATISDGCEPALPEPVLRDGVSIHQVSPRILRSSAAERHTLDQARGDSSTTCSAINSLKFLIVSDGSGQRSNTQDGLSRLRLRSVLILTIMGTTADTIPPRLGASQAITLLRRHGITPTPQRVSIARILLARAQHLSADQLLETVNGDEPRVSKATIYNTLGLFLRKGLVRAVVVDPTKVLYDSNTRSHHHFYDIKTGALVDIDETDITIPALPNLPTGSTVESVEIVVRLRSQSPE
jgi:Fur family iron response transcriptional regulator